MAVRPIVEPVGKNTAPALALAAGWIEARYGESIMAALPADHLIRPQPPYKALRARLRTCGQPEPTGCFRCSSVKPETGYGYLLLGKGSVVKGRGSAGTGYRASSKSPMPGPPPPTAATGSYRWNSGMFVWKTSVLLEEVRRILPTSLRWSRSGAGKIFPEGHQERFMRPRKGVHRLRDHGALRACQRRCRQLLWDDIGSWEAMSRIYGADESGNTTVGDRLFKRQCTGSILSIVLRTPLPQSAVPTSRSSLPAMHSWWIAVRPFLTLKRCYRNENRRCLPRTVF